MKLKVVATLNKAALNRQAAFDRQAFIFDWVKEKWAEFKDWFEKEKNKKIEKVKQSAKKLAEDEKFKDRVREIYQKIKNIPDNNNKSVEPVIKLEIEKLVEELNNKAKSGSLSPKDFDEIINNFEVGSLIKQLAKEFPAETAIATPEEDILKTKADTPTEEDVDSVLKALKDLGNISNEEAKIYKNRALNQRGKNENSHNVTDFIIGLITTLLAIYYFVIANMESFYGDPVTVGQQEALYLFAGIHLAINALLWYFNKETIMRLLFRRIPNKEPRDISKGLDDRAKNLQTRDIKLTESK